MEQLPSKPSGSSKNDSYGREDLSKLSPAVRNDLLLNEAHKLVQMLLDKEQNIEEKDQTLQQTEEEMDNLRKNIISLQTEYELLDHKYHAELSYREELERKNETTRNLVESVQNYADILASSIKMVDDDKFKITDFYNEIYRRQETTEAKRKEIEIIIKEQDELIHNRVMQITSERNSLLKQVHQMGKELSDAKDNLKYESCKKTELEKECGELKDKINEAIAEVNIMKKTESNLRKKLIIQKAKDGKLRELEEKSYKKKIKFLNSKNKFLKDNLRCSEETVLKYKDINKDLQMKYSGMQIELQKICENNLNDVKNLEEKLSVSLSENENLRRMLKKLENELENQISEHNKFSQVEYEAIRLKLQEQVEELKKVLDENSEMKKKMGEMNHEIESQTQMIDYLKIKAQNENDLNLKVNDLELKVQKYSKMETELQNKIAVLNEKLCSQRSSYEILLSEQQSHVTTLEEDVARCKAENKNTKHQLDESIKKYRDLENELQNKSDEILRLKNKIIQMSDEDDIVAGLKKTGLASEETNGNITSTVQSSSRKLFTTPVGLLGSPVPSPGLKTKLSTPTVNHTPIPKKHDPYSFDSDSSSEYVESDKVLRNLKTGLKRGNSTNKRKK